MPPADLAVTPVASRSPAKAIEPSGRGKAGANDKTGGRVAAEKAGVPAEVAKSTQPQSVTGRSTSATAVAMSSRQQDLESLLLRFMIFYEAGDLKNLLRLIDTDRLGVMQKFLLQANFENFFRDTQSRSLSIEWVRWENMLESRFRMSGQARLRAQYADDGRVVDRAVPMEITVESGPEGLKITRLSVFPND